MSEPKYEDGWRPIEEGVPDVLYLVGWWETWPGPQREWRTEANFMRSTKGGWWHSRGTHIRPLPPPPDGDAE